MNLEYFIARRLTFSKDNPDRISLPVVSIAVAGIAIGISVMILSMAIVTGFKKEVSQKVIGFGGHIQITNFDNNQSLETIPIRKDQGYYPLVDSMQGVENIQAYATKLGIIKTTEMIEGVVLKGVDTDFNWDFFSHNLIEGNVLTITDTARTKDVLISKKIADALNFKVGDKVIMMFIQDPPRMRDFVVAGIYQTGMEEFDKKFIICDIKHIQKLNDWEDNMISGFEVNVKDIKDADMINQKIVDLIGYDFFESGSKLKIQSIKEKYPQIFDWLGLLDMNVWVILILMLVVAGINMISGLLILILERTNMIGLLKAMGAENFKIQRIFLYQSLFLIGRGLFWGNLIGLTLCYLQWQFGIIKLNPENYFIAQVPINVRLIHVVLLNIGTLATTFIMLVIPSMMIAKISPVKTIQFN